MVDLGVEGVLLFAAISLCAATLAVLVSGRLLPPSTSGRGVRRGPIVFDGPAVYEFREGYLVSDLPRCDPFLAADIDRSHAFRALTQALSALSPDIPEKMASLADRGTSFIQTVGLGPDALTIGGRWIDDAIKLTVGPTTVSDGRQSIDCATLDALLEETDELRLTVDVFPMVLWKTAPNGAITWANAPYRDLLDTIEGRAASDSWPLPPIFDVALADVTAPKRSKRIQIGRAAHGTARWFEISTNPLPDGSVLWVAQDIDALVAAEAGRRTSVQTLGTVFAHLPVGLAVFDRRRKLMVFNPALMELTGLPAEFLSQAPDLESVIDEMRHRQKIPEPRDYAAWRDEVALLDHGSDVGNYQDIWALPTGQTFRVSGRPYPDGALALMFEDISDDMELTRQFRTELDLLRSVIDAQPVALAVIGPDGRVTLRNTRFSEILGAVAEQEDTEPEAWRQTPLGQEIAAAQIALAARKNPDAAMSRTLKVGGGSSLLCTVSRVVGGATLVTLKQDPGSLALAQLVEGDPVARDAAQRRASDRDVRPGPQPVAHGIG